MRRIVRFSRFPVVRCILQQVWENTYTNTGDYSANYMGATVSVPSTLCSTAASPRLVSPPSSAFLDMTQLKRPRNTLDSPGHSAGEIRCAEGSAR